MGYSEDDEGTLGDTLAWQFCHVTFCSSLRDMRAMHHPSHGNTVQLPALTPGMVEHMLLWPPSQLQVPRPVQRIQGQILQEDSGTDNESVYE